jgi:hypothetical protein
MFRGVNFTLALACLIVLAAGGVWAVRSKGEVEVSAVAPRDWLRPDSLGLAIDSAIERRLGGRDSASEGETWAARRSSGCEPYGSQLAGMVGGRTGPLLVANHGDRAVTLTVYHPDGQAWSSMRRRLPAGRSFFLTTPEGQRVIARSDWGVQVDTFCVELIDRVATWAGDHFSVSWGGGRDSDR